MGDVMSHLSKASLDGLFPEIRTGNGRSLEQSGKGSAVIAVQSDFGTFGHAGKWRHVGIGPFVDIFVTVMPAGRGGS